MRRLAWVSRPPAPGCNRAGRKTLWLGQRKGKIQRLGEQIGVLRMGSLVLLGSRLENSGCRNVQ